MRNKTIICAMTAGIIGIMLAGCGHEHTWTEARCLSPKTCSECGATEGETIDHNWSDATCEEPKTCSLCGETEGEALGHTWMDADCENPQKCSECGATEGEALGHNFTEATYWTEKTCDACGATEGGVLEPDFVKYGMPVEMELEQKYDMITVYGKEGTAKFYNYDCFYDSDVLESIDGYIFQEIYVDLYYSDPYNRVDTGVWTEDYYDIKGHDDTIADIGDDYPKWDYARQYTLHWQGEDYTECIRTDKSEWVGNTYRTHYIFRVPEGYDGNALGIIDFDNGKEGNYSYERFDENSTFIRLPAAIPDWM